MRVRNALLFDRFASQCQKRITAKAARDLATLEAVELLSLFKDEIRDFLLTLDEAHKNALSRSRKSDVLSDVIEVNGGAKAEQERAQEKATTLKKLFRGYRTMSGPMRQELQRLRFIDYRSWEALQADVS